VNGRPTRRVFFLSALQPRRRRQRQAQRAPPGGHDLLRQQALLRLRLPQQVLQVGVLRRRHRQGGQRRPPYWLTYRVAEG